MTQADGPAFLKPPIQRKCYFRSRVSGSWAKKWITSYGSIVKLQQKTAFKFKSKKAIKYHSVNIFGEDYILLFEPFMSSRVVTWSEHRNGLKRFDGK